MTRHLLLILSLPAFLMFSTGAAQACKPAFNPAEVRAALDDREQAGLPAGIGDMQTGIRAGLAAFGLRGSESVGLQDGVLGAVTRQGLRNLCAAAFPDSSDGELLVDETVDLAFDYRALRLADRSWPAALADPDLIERLAGDADEPLPRLALRIAGSPAMALAAIETDGSLAACPVGGPVAETAEGQQGMAALRRLDPALGTGPEACAAYPIAAGGTYADAFDRFGALEALRPDALEVLTDPAFTRWLLLPDGPASAGKPLPQLVRLAGTPPVVARLLAEFTGRGAPSPPTSEGCAPPEVRPGVLGYFAYPDPADTEEGDGVDVRAALVALEAQNFPSADALEAKIIEALARTLDDCQRAIVREVAAGSGAFVLDTAKISGLPAEAALTDLANGPVQDRAKLERDARALLQAAIAASVNDEVDAAAAAIADAAGQIEAAPDEPPEDLEGVENPAPVPPEPQPVDMNALLDKIPDPEFRERLEAEGLFPTLTPEQSAARGDVTKALRPEADQRIARETEQAMDRVRQALARQYRLKEIGRLLPLGQNVSLGALSENEDSLNRLQGLAYPNRALMRRAIELAAEGAGIPVSPEELTAYTGLTALSAKKPFTAIRQPLASECGCGPRAEPNSLVYAFYPFWSLPGDPVRSDEDLAAGVPPRQVDFEVIDRIAFYGLEITTTGNGGERQVQMDPDMQTVWRQSARAFVNSAHRHRSLVDVAVNLQGWEGWNDGEILAAVDIIEGLLADFDPLDLSSFGAAHRTFTAAWDAPRPDGVTLIFEGFDTPGTESHGRDAVVRTLIAALKDRLAGRDQQINIAFTLAANDQPMQATQTAALASAIQWRLFLRLEGVVSRRDEQVPGTGGGAPQTVTSDPVNRVLVFLPRSTSISKKALHLRILGNGGFQGSERQDVLRKVIPVLPAGAHRDILRGHNDQNRMKPPPKPFSQFDDDLIYFQDNFGGVGFWPVPAVPDPDKPEEITIAGIVSENWDAPYSGAVVLDFEWMSGVTDEVCRFTCPNRNYFYLVAILLMVLTGLLMIRSLFSGFALRLAMDHHLVRNPLLIVGAIWLLIAVCDPFAAPLSLLAVLVTAVYAAYAYLITDRSRQLP